MGNNTIYIIFGVVAALYLFVSMTNRRQSKNRKSRKFMEDYKRPDSDKKKDDEVK